MPSIAISPVKNFIFQYKFCSHSANNIEMIENFPKKTESSESNKPLAQF